MTEKRFTIIYNEDSKMMQYVDNQKEESNRWAIWNASETAQKLNKLNDENEQLKFFVEYEKKQHKHWKRECLENIKEIAQLKREIIQLKGDVELLKNDLLLNHKMIILELLIIILPIK